MEQKIKELIEKWEKEYMNIDVNGEYKDPDEYINTFILDLKDLLKFKQNHCCDKKIRSEYVNSR